MCVGVGAGASGEMWEMRRHCRHIRHTNEPCPENTCFLSFDQ